MTLYQRVSPEYAKIRARSGDGIYTSVAVRELGGMKKYPIQ